MLNIGIIALIQEIYVKLLQTLIEAAGPKAAVSTKDVNTYYRQVKITFKGNPAFKTGKLSRAAVYAAVHDIAENDPDSTVDASKLCGAVWAKYVTDCKTPKTVSEDFKDPEFTTSKPSDQGMTSDDQPDMSDEGGLGEEDEVAELKALRCKDIGEELTPEQQDELRDLKAGNKGDDCDMSDFGTKGGEDCQDSSMDSSRNPMGEGTNHMGERTIGNYSKWKAAVKAAHPEATFAGDKDICQALVGKKGVGAWDGESGTVEKAVVKEGWDTESDDEEDRDVKTAEREESRLGLRMSPKAKAALDKRLSRADSKEDKGASKKAAKDLDEAVANKAARAANKITQDAKLAKLSESVLACITRKDGSFLK